MLAKTTPNAFNRVVRKKMFSSEFYKLDFLKVRFRNKGDIIMPKMGVKFKNNK